MMCYLEGDIETLLISTTKLITIIKDGDNSLTEPNQIANHAVNYFKNLFVLTLFCRIII